MKSLFSILLVFISATALAQSSSRFAITREVSAGGGATVSSSSRFSLAGTIAQPLAAVPGNTRFSIQGGFWIRPAPIFFAPTTVGTNFTISIQSELGETYTVQALDSLTGSSWQNLLSVTGNGAVITVTNSAFGSPSQFFRLVQQ